MSTTAPHFIIRVCDRFLHYSLAGLVGTFAHWLLFYVLEQFTISGAMVASISGFICGAIINYLLNYYLTFRSNRGHFKAVSSFFGVAFVLLLVNIFCMNYLLGIDKVPPLLCQVLTSGIILMLGYLLNKFFTF